MKQLKDFGFEIFYDASLLGEEWDIIAADNIFLKKNSLIHLQNVNPCNQKYYINEKMGIIFVSYKLKLNIFTLKRGLDIKVPVTIIGIPFSVSYKGYSYSKQNCDILSYTIKSLKGIKLVLNADEDLNLPKGYTLPQYTLDIHWSTFDEYISSMRSHYRYRVRKALTLFKDVKGNILDNNKAKSQNLNNRKTGSINKGRQNEIFTTNKEEAFYESETSVIKNPQNMVIAEILEDTMNFSDEMYSLYLEVYENSKDKLEKLSIDFFRTYPSVIISFYIKDGQNKIPAGFVQLKNGTSKELYTKDSKKIILKTDEIVKEKNEFYIKETNNNTYNIPHSTDCDENSELIFLFAGLNHGLNLKYDIYMNMILYIISYAIENKYKRVNLGQTTMDTKLKLGAVPTEKYMYVTAKNPILRRITPLAANLLSYKEKQKEFHVFKENRIVKDTNI